MKPDYEDICRFCNERGLRIMTDQCAEELKRMAHRSSEATREEFSREWFSGLRCGAMAALIGVLLNHLL